MSHIRPFSFKYHTKIAFCILRPLRGRFPIDLISLQNQGFKTLGSGLSTTLRVVELFLVQNVGLGCANFHIMGLWPQIHRYLVMVGFCVRQSKSHQFLIGELWRLLWSFDVFQMDIFWILAKFWRSRVIFSNILFNKKPKKPCSKSVNSSRKHPVELFS